MSVKRVLNILGNITKLAEGAELYAFIIIAVISIFKN